MFQADYSDIFEGLKSSGRKVDDYKKERIIKTLDEITSYHPRIGVFGKAGVGKSSLCNALFGQDVAKVSDIFRGTLDPQSIFLGIGSKGITLLDVPGLGESKETDKKYTDLYRSLLPELDLVLWLLRADDRALSIDGSFCIDSVKPHLDQGKAFLVVLNKVDIIKPHREWNEENNCPGPTQSKNIETQKDKVSKDFDVPVSKIVPVSAEEKYNLVNLIDQIVDALPNEKKITFVQHVDPQFLSQATKEAAQTGLKDYMEHLPAIAEIMKATPEIMRELTNLIEIWRGE